MSALTDAQLEAVADLIYEMLGGHAYFYDDSEELDLTDVIIDGRLNLREFAAKLTGILGWQPIKTAPAYGRFLVAGGRITYPWPSDYKPNEEVVLVNRCGDGNFPIENDEMFAEIIDPEWWQPLPRLPERIGGDQ